MPKLPTPAPDPGVAALATDIKALISQARQSVAVAVNAELTRLYWRIGGRINGHLQADGRAAYGQQVVATLARELRADYGTSYTEKYLRRMMQFATAFPDEAIVESLLRQLSWTHFVALLPLREPLQRQFYTELCRLNRWSVRELRRQIEALLYERTAISRQPEAAIAQQLAALHQTQQLSPELVFKDTYVLDFLGLAAGTYSEATLEEAIVGRIQEFLLEMGQGFAFVERQKRIAVDDTDYYLDLLFYHRKLRRLVAIDLKLGKFRPEHKGQMELYLRWLQRHEMQPGEDPPVGLLLCSEGHTEHIELLLLDQPSGDIRVAQYLTELPPADWFRQKLHRAIELAEQQLAHHPDNA